MTNETKHTPGPWRVNGGLVIDSRDNIVAVRRSRDHLTKDPNHDKGDYISPVEADANVRLLAAAPELKARVLSLENTLSVISYYLDEPNGITVKRMKELCEQALYPQTPTLEPEGA